MMSNDVLQKNPAHEEVMSSNEGSTMLSAWLSKHVVMQAAMVKVMPPYESTFEVTRVLMDSGSSRTYVTEEIVKRLKLEPTESDKLTIFTFGISKPKEITLPLFTLTMKSTWSTWWTSKRMWSPRLVETCNECPSHLRTVFHSKEI